jgi:prefoldin alpha subunit
MYVPGNIIDNEKFMIDIGTGYYVEKDNKGAVDFFARKVAFLNSQIEKIVKMVQEKHFLRDNIIEIIQVKSQQMMPASAASAQASNAPLTSS